MEHRPFDAAYGMSLLREHKFDEASEYFSRHLDDNAVACYGLALAKFRTDVPGLSVERLREITALYEMSIELSPDFADAYLMCAMAYRTMAGFQFSMLDTLGIQEPRSLLNKADAYLDKAVALNPRFDEIVREERDRNQLYHSALDTCETAAANDD